MGARLRMSSLWVKNFGREVQINVYRKLDRVQQGVKIMGSFLGKECSPIFAQRIFRSYRILQLHSKLWANSFVMRRPNSRQWLLGFVMYSLCHPKESLQMIEESELMEHINDLDFIHELTAATVVCPDCSDRLVVDKKLQSVKYCHCPNSASAYDKKISGYKWTPYVETPDLLIWRQPHPDRPGLFLYKVYGYYDDISPKDFLSTQLDIEYRKEWDDTVLKLEIVNLDEKQKSEVIYWEMKWPRMFSNRDYLFARRHMVDEEKKTMIIMSKAITIPEWEEKKGVHRVTEYWSVMQIQAVRGMDEPGVEFGLTYYDNPGLSLPGWMNNWAAMTAIPDFLNKQRNAAREKLKSTLKVN